MLPLTTRKDRGIKRPAFFPKATLIGQRIVEAGIIERRSIHRFSSIDQEVGVVFSRINKRAIGIVKLAPLPRDERRINYRGQAINGIREIEVEIMIDISVIAKRRSALYQRGIAKKGLPLIVLP